MHTEIPPKLRWSCRRGMLELDIMLTRFLENAYLKSSTKDQELFEKLLACEDQDLFEWLTGKKIPVDSEIQDIVNKVKRTHV